MKDFGFEKAEELLQRFKKFVVDFDDTDIKFAANFRFDNKKSNLSMADCIGYVVAKRLHVKFLTGDKQFEHFENVEFVK